MHQSLTLLFALVGVVLLPVMGSHDASQKFSSKSFEGLSIGSRSISEVKCFSSNTTNARDFATAATMLSTYCRHYKVAHESPYVAVVGQTTAYVCAHVGPEICSGRTMDKVNELLTDKCGCGTAGHVRLGDVNATYYGRGVVGAPVCRGLANGVMKNYKFHPIPVFVNGTLVG